MRFGKNAKEHRFEAVTVLRQPMLFTTDHLDHGTIPRGMHLYAVRHHSEDRKKPIQICQWAVANRYGSLLSTKPIYLQRHPKLDNSLRDIDPDKDWVNEGYETTLKEYLYDHPAKNRSTPEHER